jgi:hypothetical protein
VTHPYTFTCRCCQKDTILHLEPEKLAIWKAGGLIQRVFPDLTPGERELMVSRTCPECWDRIFGPEEDDD